MLSNYIGFWLITVSFVFGLMIYVGMVTLRILYRKKSMNLLIMLGGGMIMGPLVYLLSINFLDYIFKGRGFLITLFITLVLLAIYLVKITKIKLFSKSFRLKNKKSIKLIPIYFLLALNIFLIYIFIGRANVGGDVLQYWAIATSFARGNFPTIMPYQPNFLTVYHTGTYIILGMLQVLTKLDIYRVHFLFAFYILASMFIFSVGMALKERISLSGIIPPIFGLILFGTPIILTHSNYRVGGLNTPIDFVKNIFKIIKSYPTFDINFGSVGGGAVSLESLMYIIHIAFGLAVFLLFVYLLTEREKNNPFKDYILLIILTNLNLAINEVFVPIQLFIIGIFFIYDYRKHPIKTFLSSAIVLTSIFVSLFFIIQNSMRDSLFTPSTEAPRVQIVIPPFKNIEQLTSPLHRVPPYHDIAISSDERGSWYLMDIRLLIIAGLVLSFITRMCVPFIFSIAAFISLLCKIFIWYTFSPWSGYRFFSQSHQLMAFAFGFLIIGMLQKKTFKFISLLFLFLVLPQGVASYTKIINISTNKSNRNYVAHNPENPDLKILSYTIPAKDRILIISFSQDGNINHYISGEALYRYGLIVPLGPSDAKILNIATGIEWYDAATYLDPYSVGKLGVDYVYLDGDALKFLPDRRVREFYDKAYFNQIMKTSGGILFNVTDNFKNIRDDTDPTLRKMVSNIESNKNIYLDKIYGDIRRLMFLSLAKKNSRLFGQGYLHLFGGEYYMAVEIPFVQITEDTRNVKNIDYAVMRPEVNPSDVVYGEYQKIAETQFAYLWKRIY